MHLLTLPEFGSVRWQAQRLYEEQGIPERLDGQCLAVTGRLTRHVSDLYVDEIVRIALARGVAEIALLGAPRHVVEFAEDAAWRRGRADVVAVRRAVEIGL